MCWWYLILHKRATVIDRDFLYFRVGYFVQLMASVNIYRVMSCKDRFAWSWVDDEGYLPFLNVQTKEHITVVWWTHTMLIIPPHDRHVHVLQTWQWKPIATNSIQHGSTDSQPHHQMCHLMPNFVIRRQRVNRSIIQLLLNFA